MINTLETIRSSMETFINYRKVSDQKLIDGANQEIEKIETNEFGHISREKYDQLMDIYEKHMLDEKNNAETVNKILKLLDHFKSSVEEQSQKTQLSIQLIEKIIISLNKKYMKNKGDNLATLALNELPSGKIELSKKIMDSIKASNTDIDDNNAEILKNKYMKAVADVRIETRKNKKGGKIRQAKRTKKRSRKLY